METAKLKIDKDEIVKKSVESVSIDEILKKCASDFYMTMQKEAMWMLFWYLVPPFALMGVMWYSWLANLSGTSFIGLCLGVGGLTWSVCEATKSRIAKTTAGIMLHRSLFITKNDVYSIMWAGKKVGESEIGDGWYLSEHVCDPKFSTIPHIVLIHKGKYEECYSFRQRETFRYGVICPVLCVDDTIVEYRMLPEEYAPAYGDQTFPVIIGVVLDCDYTRNQVMKAFGVLPYAETEVAQKVWEAYDKIQTPLLKELLALKEARIKELEQTLVSHHEMAAAATAQYVGQKEIFGKIIRSPTKTIWKTLKPKQKMMIIVGVAVVCALILILAIAL